MNIFFRSGCHRVLCVIVLLVIGLNTKAQHNFEPTDLRVDLLRNTDKVWENGFEVKQRLEKVDHGKNNYQTVRISNNQPWFSWAINDPEQNIYQTAYQILISSSAKQLKRNVGDVWNSGKVLSGQQLGIAYNGKELSPNTVYYWKVIVWDNRQNSGFSNISSFLTDSVLKPYQAPHSPLVKSVQLPLISRTINNSTDFYDFGNDAFGQLTLTVKTKREKDTLLVHVGEAVDEEGNVKRRTNGVIRYQQLVIPLKKGKHTYYPVFKANSLNTSFRSIHMPAYIGQVLPFRYVQIEKPDSKIKIMNVERYAVNYIFDDTAMLFESSDTVLNKIWDLCKHTMKATSFTGYYIDGDRERTPYEADALINQLSHYASDAEYNMAKRSLEYLIYHATWPTEWSLQNLLIAWNDYMYSGDIRTVKSLYEELKPKTLTALARADGLISTQTDKQDSTFTRTIHLLNFGSKTVLRDIVDWPQKGGVGLPPLAIGETDNFEFKAYNSVVNAFHYRALVCMKKLAETLDKKEDAALYNEQANKVKVAFQHSFIDSATGLVKDGEGTAHSSLHANMMALAFGLVPQKNIQKVLSFIHSRGMACSVYGAQFLLDALYDADDGAYGLKLLTSTDKRSWYNMIRSGSTMTTEAWATEFKGNQDWNHAWGSAPANIIVEKLMGITPLTPAFGSIEIKPRPGALQNAQLKLATLRGRVEASFNQDEQSFNLTTRLPANTNGIVYLPKKKLSDKVYRNGKKITASSDGDFWKIENVQSGEDSWRVDYKNVEGT